MARKSDLAALDNLVALVVESFGDDKEIMRDVDRVIALRNELGKVDQH